MKRKLTFKPLITRKLEREASLSEQVAHVLRFCNRVVITETSRAVTFKLIKAKER